MRDLIELITQSASPGMKDNGVSRTMREERIIQFFELFFFFEGERERERVFFSPRKTNILKIGLASFL